MPTAIASRLRVLLTFIAALFLISPPANAAQLTITEPPPRIVMQRDHTHHAAILVAGTAPATTTRVEARLVPRQAGQGTATDWMVVDATPKAGAFHGLLPGEGGWYNLEVRALEGTALLTAGTQERVGIGEVFIVVGHSVAAGQLINIDPLDEDRVVTVPLDKSSADYEAYRVTGDPAHLPAPGFAPYGRDVQPAPFGEGTYFWARFAGLVAQKENVPVLLYNAAFGGTSLEHWSKSAQGLRFEHSFVRSGIRMPYINLANTLTKYIPLTGVRAILADQGANDWPEKNADVIFAYYETWVRQARADLHHPELAIVVNRHTPFFRDRAVRQAQERMLATSFCFPGPDYDRFAPEDRPDQIHLGASGEMKAATMWAEALNTDFFERSQPWLPPLH